MPGDCFDAAAFHFLKTARDLDRPGRIGIVIDALIQWACGSVAVWSLHRVEFALEVER